MSELGVKVSVDAAENLLRIVFSGTHEVSEVKAAIKAAYDEVAQVHGYDVLFDLPAFAGTPTPEDVAEVMQYWQAVAKGRDVGRRSAVICRDPFVFSLINGLKYLSPYRTVTLFSNSSDAAKWLKGLEDGKNDGVQLI